jgi:hypothetical protein
MAKMSRPQQAFKVSRACRITKRYDAGVSGWIFPNQVVSDYLMSECPVRSYSSSKVSQSGHRSHYVITIDVPIEGGVIKVF